MLYAVVASLLIAGINSEIWNATMGSTATIVCSSEKTEVCKLRKIFKGHVIDRNNRNNERFLIKNSESCIFEVQNSHPNDTGIYTCQIDNDVRKSFTFSVFVESSEPQMIINNETILTNQYNTKTIVHPDKNGNVTFKCQSEQSYPRAFFSWYINGIVVTTDAIEEAH
uniref:Immunoglobulin domain-containing protein n=1 Tax=Strigamia maritima TaxID=126957 RepID=T1J9J4_STRMM